MPFFSMRVRKAFTACLLALLAGCVTTPPTVEQPSARAVPSEALNADVRQDTIHQTICVPGYTASVRPAASYTNGVKRRLVREQSMPDAQAADYELDHRVPLALGGHPRALVNLGLQPWPDAKRKDVLEKRLQGLVCGGKVGLAVAQSEIYFDWTAAHRKYVGER
jgi:hypothetical protein